MKMKKNKILRESLQIEAVNKTIDFIDKKRNKSLGLFSSKGDYTEYCTVIDFLYEYKNILNIKLKKMKTKLNFENSAIKAARDAIANETVIPKSLKKQIKIKNGVIIFKPNNKKKMKTKENTTSKQLFGRTFQLTKSKEIALEITEMMFGKKAANKALKKFEETFIPKN